MKMSNFKLPELINFKWPDSPSYENPIKFIESTEAENYSPYFKFTLENA